MLLKVGIVTRNEGSYCSTQLRQALDKRDIPHMCFSFPQLIAHIGYRPYVKVADSELPENLDALLIRPIGRGSLEELVFRMDVLYRLERLGLCVINRPEAIEHCVDKYDVLAILEENGVSVPRTAVTESVDEALKAFEVLGGDVIVKPVFGSRGLGSTRIIDREIASTIFRSITFYHGVIYLQEFVQHGFSDIRTFVVGDRVVAAMRRVAKGWKTNYSQGASPHGVLVDQTLEKISVESAHDIGCEIAGIDILEGPSGPVIVDINSQPGWRGLQSVSQTNVADEIVDFIVSKAKG